MKCLYCSQQIHDDSMFCESCGQRIPRCPTCGCVITQRSAFCIHDGTPIPDEINAMIPDMPVQPVTCFCVRCGRPTTEENGYCPDCRRILTEPRVSVRYCEECGKPCETRNQRLCNTCSSRQSKKAPRKKKGFGGLLLIILLLIAAFGAGLWLVRSGIVDISPVLDKFVHTDTIDDDDDDEDKETDEESDHPEEDTREKAQDSEGPTDPDTTEEAIEAETTAPGEIESEAPDATQPAPTATEETEPKDAAGIQVETQSTDPLASLEVGDTFYFGTYEQDNNFSNGAEEILWIVLAKEDGRIMVTSFYGLDSIRYHATNESVTWETCSIRSWLNDVFYYTAFSGEEREKIIAAEVLPDINPDYGTNPGNVTTDYVFLLSLSQTLEYFPSKTDRLLYPTAYAVAQNAWKDSGTGTGWWLLLTPGKAGNYVVSINTDGSLDIPGGGVASDKALVRPVIWIEVG